MAQTTRFIRLVIVASALLTGPAELFAQCGDPDAGDCCEANFTPGCVNSECCELICSLEPFCCDADLSGGGIVDVLDMLALLGAWR